MKVLYGGTCQGIFWTKNMYKMCVKTIREKFHEQKYVQNLTFQKDVMNFPLPRYTLIVLITNTPRTDHLRISKMYTKGVN